jgi:hypothetical protein
LVVFKCFNMKRVGTKTLQNFWILSYFFKTI